MALIQQVEKLLGKKVVPSLFQIHPAKRCIHKGEEYFAHGFRDDDSNEFPETLVLSKREDSLGQWKNVPYQEVEFIAEEGGSETKNLAGYRLTKIAGIYMVSGEKKIPAKMVVGGRLVWVYGMTDADHNKDGLVHYWVGPEEFNPEDEPRMVPEKDVILLV